MNVLGALLLIGGTIAAGIVQFGRAPGAPVNATGADAPFTIPGPLHSLGLSPAMWLGVAALGAVILYLNRRPSD
jgi:hypothetical protein